MYFRHYFVRARRAVGICFVQSATASVWKHEMSLPEARWRVQPHSTQNKDRCMIDATLMELTKEVRWKTLKILETVEDETAHFKPAGLNNTILWHAGHALVVVEQICFVFPTGSIPPYPADWFDKFSWNSTPASVTQWPALADVVEQLKDQRQRLFSLIETLAPEQLDRVIGEAPRNRTFRGMIVHALHDEANHQGEMHLLKKLWKLRS
jgi:hypothetical protein